MRFCESTSMKNKTTLQNRTPRSFLNKHSQVTKKLFRLSIASPILGLPYRVRRVRPGPVLRAPPRPPRQPAARSLSRPVRRRRACFHGRPAQLRAGGYTGCDAAESLSDGARWPEARQSRRDSCVVRSFEDGVPATDAAAFGDNSRRQNRCPERARHGRRLFRWVLQGCRTIVRGWTAFSTQSKSFKTLVYLILFRMSLKFSP